MPTLYFIRHAKTAMNADGLWSGRTDCSITAEGAEKAKKSFSLTADEFDYFYCSPLQRTQQTLKILGNHSEPRIDARIIERDFGEWEGKPYSILTSAETQMFSKYRGNEKILIVTHATVCRMVRDVFLPDMAKGSIKNAQMIKVTESDFNDFKRR